MIVLFTLLIIVLLGIASVGSIFLGLLLAGGFR